MHTVTANGAGPSEIAIFARVLGNEAGQLPADVAQFILSVGFSDDDKGRMHDLAVRNQEDALSEKEKEELFAYSKAGTMLSILKSRARRALRTKPTKPPMRPKKRTGS